MFGVVGIRRLAIGRVPAAVRVARCAVAVGVPIVMGVRVPFARQVQVARRGAEPADERDEHERDHPPLGTASRAERVGRGDAHRVLLYHVGVPERPAGRRRAAVLTVVTVARG